MHKALRGSKIAGLIAVMGFALLLATVMPVMAVDTVGSHSTVADTELNQVTWDCNNFSGFYYDINKNLGAETITFRPTDATPTGATLSDQPDELGDRGVVYTTHAQLKIFKYKPWGQYHVIGFLANKYFAAYDNTQTADVAYAGGGMPFLYGMSKNRNLMTNEQLSEILIDDNTEMLINSSSPLKLAEGYELALKYVNSSQALVELKKDGQLVDTNIIQPSIPGATMDDKTYCYKRNIGDTSDIITIAVHFKNSIHGPDKDSAIVDGIFQISDTPVAISTDQKYGKMSIRNVDATNMVVTMDNKDNQIILTKNKDIPLMGKIHIKTADQDGTAAAPLRYYIYSEETYECG